MSSRVRYDYDNENSNNIHSMTKQELATLERHFWHTMQPGQHCAHRNAAKIQNKDNESFLSGDLNASEICSVRRRIQK